MSLHITSFFQGMFTMGALVLLVQYIASFKNRSPMAEHRSTSRSTTPPPDF